MTSTHLLTDPRAHSRTFRGAAVFAFSVLSYAVACATFVGMAGFLGGFIVPKTIDDGPSTPVFTAIGVDLALLALFSVHHSAAARERFKRVVRRLAPPSAERATYVLVSSLLMLLVMVAWRPLPATVWAVASDGARTAIQAAYAFGWVLLLAATFMIDHFDLFGLRQGWSAARGLRATEPSFRTPWLYRLVRHPIYVGWLVIFWAAPTMSYGRLLFAGATTAYILIAIVFEERDLVRRFGAAYEAYRARTPMLLPRFRRAA